MISIKYRIFLLLCLIGVQGISAQDSEPVLILDRQLINQDYAGDQHKVSIAINRHADFVITWVDTEANILYCKTGDRFGNISDVVVVDDRSESEDAFTRSNPPICLY